MNQPAEAYVCPDGEHAWSSSHEPHAPIWIISCIICGRHNFTEMLAEHDRAVAERGWDECSKARKYGIKSNPYRKES